jgi:hypothetical protein
MDKRFICCSRQTALSKEISGRQNRCAFKLALSFSANDAQVQSPYFKCLVVRQGKRCSKTASINFSIKLLWRFINSQFFKPTRQFFGTGFARCLFIYRRFPALWFVLEPAIRLLWSHHNFQVRVHRALKPKIATHSPDFLTSLTTFLYVSRNHSIGNADVR